MSRRCVSRSTSSTATRASTRIRSRCWSTNVTCAPCRSIRSPRAPRSGLSSVLMAPMTRVSRTYTAAPRERARTGYRMRCGERVPSREGGFTYVGLLVLVLLIGVMMAAAGEVASTATQRERETELLFIGNQYRDAIGRFVTVNHRFPQSLEELVGLGGDSILPKR